MTIAICQFCGAFKNGALVPCSNCQKFPEDNEQITTAIALTDHYFEIDDLKRLSQEIEKGKEIELDNLKENGIFNLLEGSSLNSILKNSKTEGTSIRIDFFDFSEEIFTLSNEIFNLREEVIKKSGTFLSVILNLFRKVNYSNFYDRALIIQEKIQLAKANIDVYLDPKNKLEKVFLSKIRAHLNDIEDLANILAKKYNFMVRKSDSSSAKNTSFNNWQSLTKKENLILDDCQKSGDSLTMFFQQHFREK